MFNVFVFCFIFVVLFAYMSAEGEIIDVDKYKQKKENESSIKWYFSEKIISQFMSIHLSSRIALELHISRLKRNKSHAIW